MTKISPILNSRLNNNPNNINSNNMTSNKAYQEKMYENIVRQADEVKPNEAKAKLVKEGPIASVGSYFKDLKQDIVNTFKAARTGKMNDHNLGRINDLGLKLGAILIATYLAAHSKTKKEAIMKYVGGGAFFASMSLWPKIFLNLPARFVHGFNIGQKYISAQGDKKDFFLDNQFLPWDTYSDEELAEIGKRTGIDINSENGKEKIQRKMQKVALQNRTLWMATAGFATPLMTALFCDRVEPHIENAIINSNFKKVEEALFGKEEAKGIAKVFEAIKEKLSLLKPAPKSTVKGTKTAVETFFETNSAKDKDFFENLSSLLNIKNLINLPSDEKNPLASFINSKETSMGALKKFYAQKTTINIDESKLFETLKKVYSNQEDDLFGVSDKQILNVIEKLKQNPTIGNFKAILNGSADTALKEETFEGLIKNLDVDESQFKSAVSSFFKSTVLPAGENIKGYLKLLNPAIGTIAESKSTQFIVNSLEDMLKALNLNKKELNEIIKKAGEDEIAGVLQKYFVKQTAKLEYGSKEYNELITNLLNANFQTTAKQKAKIPFVDGIAQRFSPKSQPGIFDRVLRQLEENVQNMRPNVEGETKELLNAAQGTGKNNIYDSILNFIRVRKVDIASFGTKAAFCANFEARLKEGKIIVEGFGDLKENPELLNAARKLIYQNSQSLRENNLDIGKYFTDPKGVYAKLKDALFSDAAFKDEPEILKQFAKTLREQAGNNEQNFISNMNFSQQVKNAAQRILNNKNWKSTFIPMFAVLVAITLLVQPLFGNIRKEYPEKAEGGKNNDKSN